MINPIFLLGIFVSSFCSPDEWSVWYLQRNYKAVIDCATTGLVYMERRGSCWRRIDCICKMKPEFLEVLKREPKNFKNRSLIFAKFWFPLKVTFWMLRNIPWALSFRMVCSTCLCDHYFGRYRRPNLSKCPKMPVKHMLKWRVFGRLWISQPFVERFGWLFDQKISQRLVFQNW